MKQVSVIIIGAGSRGTGYSKIISENPQLAKVIAIAEPRRSYRQGVVNLHHIPLGNIAEDWVTLGKRPKFADVVIIATQDHMHLEPTLVFAKKGYHILLEKPMATDTEGCIAIANAVMDNDVFLALGHVLRYTQFTRKMKEIVDSGVIGDIVNIQRIEPLGYWHQAHSYVRGNWRREDESTPMLLAKCSHDIDWISHIIGERCKAVHSFGTLKHFRKENKPADASERCLDCNHEPKCPYSAKKIYIGRLEKGTTDWPLNVLTPLVTKETIITALQDGPYGQCVYECDNDVVDNQVVNMQFEGGATASLTMVAFTEANTRQTRIFGTKGELMGDGSVIRHFDFLTDTWNEIDTRAPDSTIIGGHGGGDQGLTLRFLRAIAENNSNYILSNAEASLESHLIVFAAEVSRNENRVVKMNE